MAFPSTFASDFEDFSIAVKSNNTAGILAAQDSLPKIIDCLMRRQAQLRSSEADLLSRLRRDVSITVATTNSLDSNTRSNPTQSYENNNRNVSDPDPIYGVAMSHMTRAAVGINYLIRELNKISSELKSIDADIVSANDLLKELSVKNDASKIEQKDLDKDKIAQTMISSLIGLREMGAQFAFYSTEVDGSRAYSENSKNVKILRTLRYNFKALANRNPWVLSGDIVLDYTDPGSEANLTALNEIIDKLRGTVGIPDKVDADVQKYVDEVVAHVNDPSKSKEVNKNPEPMPDPNTQVSATLSKVSSAWNSFYKGLGLDSVSKLSQKTYQDAETKWFLSGVSKLHNGIPICQTTPSEEAELNFKIDAKAKAAESQAGTESVKVVNEPTQYNTNKNEVLKKSQKKQKQSINDVLIQKLRAKNKAEKDAAAKLEANKFKPLTSQKAAENTGMSVFAPGYSYGSDAVTPDERPSYIGRGGERIYDPIKKSTGQ